MNEVLRQQVVNRSIWGQEIGSCYIGDIMGSVK